jgi:hypothetical protein
MIMMVTGMMIMMMILMIMIIMVIIAKTCFIVWSLFNMQNPCQIRLP